MFSLAADESSCSATWYKSGQMRQDFLGYWNEHAKSTRRLVPEQIARSSCSAGTMTRSNFQLRA